MGMKLKWHMRQLALGLVASLFSCTSALLVLMTIKCWKLYQYGLGMYPQYDWPKHTSLQYILGHFYDMSIHPLLIWIPVTLIVDLMLRRFIYQLDE